MIINNTIVTIDDTTTATVAVNKDDKLGIIKFNTKEAYPSEATLIFGESKAVEDMQNILADLLAKMKEIESKIILPNKKLKTI
jgi:hypothetical protein